VVAQKNVTEGNAVCIYTQLQNLNDPSTGLPVNETLTVTNALTPGAIYFQGLCQAPPSSSSFGPNSPTWNCTAFWNTADAYNYTGSMGYQIGVVARFSNSSTVVNGGSNINVEGGTGSTNVIAQVGSSTTTSIATAKYDCGGGTFKLLTPVTNSSLYLRVVTDSGSAVNDNGTVFVTHSQNPGDATSNYCLRLQGNATGYMPLMGNDGLPATGSFNMTLLVGYDNGPGYQGTVPAVTAQPNGTVYVTISVPSGTVTVTKCLGGTCTTTTASATSLGG
jgi:hypothetical protein